MTLLILLCAYSGRSRYSFSTKKSYFVMWLWAGPYFFNYQYAKVIFPDQHIQIYVIFLHLTSALLMNIDEYLGGLHVFAITNSVAMNILQISLYTLLTSELLNSQDFLIDTAELCPISFQFGLEPPQAIRCQVSKKSVIFHLGPLPCHQLPKIP